MFGDGPVELVFVGPIVTHVELCWTQPDFKAFFDQLATFCRVLLFDKAGVGLSDPITKVRLLEDRAAEIEAVIDAAGFEKPVLFAMSEGGPQAIVFAAKRPERTRALILYGSLAFAAGGSWDDLDRDPAELRRATSPSWVRTTRRRPIRSPVFWNCCAPPARRGAAVRQRTSCSRRSGRHANAPCSSA